MEAIARKCYLRTFARNDSQRYANNSQYAAMAGHTDLCAMLIRAGADKSALVYEGPTESVL